MTLSAPGARNAITDVAGIRVGHADDVGRTTGTTVVLFAPDAVIAADVRGGAPGTRETDLSDPACLVERAHAVVLSGGSAFGLAAAEGVMDWLAAREIGYPVGPHRVPIVPAAILFDLGFRDQPGHRDRADYRALGAAACDAAGADLALGSVGAGRGAMAGRRKGGIGSASLILPGGITVGALVAANPHGEVMMPDGVSLWAWALEQGGEFGTPPPPGRQPAPPPASAGRAGGNTTIALVATDASLSKSALRRVAIMAQDGIAQAIQPAHTPFDGDTVFAAATGSDAPVTDWATVSAIGAAAANCLARAIGRAVLAAGALPPA